jgi:hypothetical protein
MKRLLLLATLSLSACAGGNNIDYLRMRDIPAPSIESFTHCYNYGCAKRETLSLSTSTREKIDQIFKTPHASAKEEQSRIIKSIQVLETEVGEETGTRNDKRGTFLIYEDDASTTQSFQQDCIDESTNTTTYLTLLNNIGYLEFYEPGFPANRHPFMSGNRWWHQTATIKDKTTDERYAVDSWFEDNGIPAHIIPLEEWKKGWKPKR